MEPIDREVIALRFSEQLSNLETAAELGLQESAASKRFMRAIEKPEAEDYIELKVRIPSPLGHKLQGENTD